MTNEQQQPENAQAEPIPQQEIPAPTEQVPAGIAGPLKDIDPEKLKALEAAVAQFKRGGGQTTESGSEAVPVPDLSQFELDPDYAHFYSRAEVQEDENGVAKWFVAVHEYMILSDNWTGARDKNGQPGLDKQGRPRGLDSKITSVVNGPDGIMSVPKHGWKLTALIPNGSGLGIAVFERNAKMALPDPKPVETQVELEEVKDEELVRANERAKNWQEGERDENTGEVPSDPDQGQNVEGVADGGEGGADHLPS